MSVIFKMQSSYLTPEGNVFFSLKTLLFIERTYPSNILLAGGQVTVIDSESLLQFRYLTALGTV